MLKKLSLIIFVLLVAAITFAAVRDPISANRVAGTLTIEAGRTLTKTIYVGDANGNYPGNTLKLSIYSETLIGQVVIGPTTISASPHVNPDCPECMSDPNTLWAQADITISPADADVGAQTIWLVAEDQQADPNAALRNQDYKKIAVNITKRIDITPPCIGGF